jgi:PAS domain S-box-containing protein
MSSKVSKHRRVPPTKYHNSTENTDRSVGGASFPTVGIGEKTGPTVPLDASTETAEPRGGPRQGRSSPRNESRRVVELESELVETRDYLQSVQEQYESINEELQASNEEVQSANEELQSINEELETSKEELESANEELTTVNEEMANRNADLNRLNSDLVNIQTSANLAIVLLGRDLTIRRFSVRAAKLWNLLATDIGRPFGQVRHNLVFEERRARPASGYPHSRHREGNRRQRSRTLKTSASSGFEAARALPDLEHFITDVIHSGREQEREVRDNEGCWYSLRVRPYLTLENKVDGAVLVLVDIDAIKQKERMQTAALEFAQSTVDTVREPLLVLDDKLRVHSAGRSFYQTFRVTPEETIGRFIYDLGNGQWNIPRLRQLLEEILPQNSGFDDLEVEHEFERLGRRTMCLNARRLEDVGSGSQWILLAIEDIAESKRLQQEIQGARLAEAVVRTARDPLLILENDLHVRMASEAFYRVFQVSPGEIEGQSIFDLGSGQWNLPKLRLLLERILPGDSSFDNFEVTHDFDRIGHRTMVLNGRKLAGVGPPEKILLGIQDITAQKRAEAAQARLAAIVESSDDAIISKDLNGVITSWNKGAERLFGYLVEEVVGQSVTILIPSGRFEEEAVILERIRRGEHIEHYETVRRRKDGTLLEVSLTISPITDSQGHVVGASKIVRDVTERKHTEKTLALLAAVNQDLVRLTGTDEIMQSAGARLGAHLDLSGCNFVEINETADQAVCTHEWSRGDVPSTVGIHTLADYVTDDFRKSTRAEEVVVVRDTVLDPRTNREKFDRLSIRSFVSVPLARDGQWKALFNVYHVTPHDWQDDEIALVRDLATRVWTRLERARAEEALRRAAEFDEAVMTNMGEGLYTVDDQGLVTFMNPAAEKLFGWKLEELLGKKMHEMTHYRYPDGRPFPASECAGLQVLKQGKTLTEHEDVFISKNGTFLDVVYSSSPLREAGKIKGLVVVFRDVSERKKAEEALRKSEQRFARFMQHLPGLAWIKDVEGRYVYVNDRAETAFAAQRAELYGRTDQELFPPETASQFTQNDQQALASESGIQTIETLTHTDGTVHYSIVSKFPIPGPEGQTVLVGGVAFDITEQKRAEEALRESEARFRLLADSAPGPDLGKWARWL